ncbi:MAG: DNA integrity scanning diadenylate cyclase DisA [Fusobacteriaceae bacterium]
MNNDEILEVISQITPGTKLREGVYNILEGGRGGLIVVGMNDEIEKMLDGGFFIDCEYTPEKLYELAKMDGAIVIDENIEKIFYANVHLHPKTSYGTTESGTRHRTAERMARQTNKLVVAVSERKKHVSLYKGDFKYILKHISVVLDQANQALKTLEKYKAVLEKELDNLTLLELEELVTIREVASVLQRFEMVYRIKKELRSYIVELGRDGRLLNLQSDELLLNVKEEKREFLKDYFNYEKGELNLEKIYDELEKLSDKELLDLEKFSYILGYGKSPSTLDNKVVPKGFRLLSKISKLSKKDIEKLTDTYENLTALQDATEDDLATVKGISIFKIKAIRRALREFSLR